MLTHALVVSENFLLGEKHFSQAMLILGLKIAQKKLGLDCNESLAYIKAIFSQGIIFPIF